MSINEELDLELEAMDSVELSDEELEAVAGGKKLLYVKASEANIRSGPGKEYPILWTLGKNDELIYKGKTEKDLKGKTWVKINAAGVTGWIRKDLVKK